MIKSFIEGKRRISLPQKVGGHILQLTCLGNTAPTVILESGLGGPGAIWAGIAEQVSKFTRVCFYDRAGYGQSENGPLPRTVDQLVAELYSMLEKAEVPGPYLLVGHSLGGLIARIFYQAHPNDVVGAILIDSPHENVFESGFYSKATHDKLSTLFLEHNKIEVPSIIEQEGSDVERCLAQLRSKNQLETKPFGNIPLVVIQTGKDDVEGFLPFKDDIIKKLVPAEQKEFEFILNNALKIKQIQQKELSLLSKKNRPVVVAYESHHHNIQVVQPNLVVDEIRKMVEELRLK